MHVLPHLHEALRPRGLVLEIHPTADDVPIRAGGRGLGFVDSRQFVTVVEQTDSAVDRAVARGLYTDVRREYRDVIEVYDDAAELLDTADDWENLHIDASTRRRVRAASGPYELPWPVSFRLLRKRKRGQTPLR